MRYFEDFSLGQTKAFPPRRVTEAEIIAFARDYDPQPFHIDPAAAAASPFGGIIASGWHTAGMMMRLIVDHSLKTAASMGSPGVEQLRWLRPVRPEDVLHLKGTIVDLQPSRSKPDRGVITTAYELRNQNGEVVLTMRGKSMYGRRPAGMAGT